MVEQWKSTSKFIVGKTYCCFLDETVYVCIYTYNDGQGAVFKSHTGREFAYNNLDCFEEKQEVTKEVRRLAIGGKGGVTDITNPSCYYNSSGHFEFDLEVNRVDGQIVSLWVNVTGE